MNDSYDLIVIGSGPGGASLAYRLAPTGKRILLLERGDYLPRTPTNWDAKAVFVDGVYQARETNGEAHRRLVARWKQDLNHADVKALMLQRSLYFGKPIPTPL